MHPTALMQSLMDIVGSQEVRAKDSLEAFAQHRFDHFAASRMMILIITQLRGTGTPEVAIASIFSPSRFIHLHRRAGANLLLDLSQLRPQLCCDALCQAYDLSTTDRESMQTHQVRLDLSHRQAHDRPQIGNQAGNLHAEASLSH